MNRLLKTSCGLLAGLCLFGCGSSEPAVFVNLSHDCSETSCEVFVEVRNPGNDPFLVEYEFAAFDRDSKQIVKLDESKEVEGRLSWSHQYSFPVTSEPARTISGTGYTRISS